MRSGNGRKRRGTQEAHLSLALPIDEETVFVDLERTVELDFRVVLLLRPAIEDASGTERFRHLDLPVELEPLRHLRGVPPTTSGRVSPDTAFFPGSVNKDQLSSLKASTEKKERTQLLDGYHATDGRRSRLGRRARS